MEEINNVISSNNSRFSNAPWFTFMQNVSITIIGVGGIGSYVTFLASRLNPRSLEIYDGDIVEEVNLSGQLFSLTDIGRPKVESMAVFCNNYSRYNKISYNNSFFTYESSLYPIVICGLDNMESRATTFEKWLNGHNKGLFIDGRLAAEEYQIFAIDREDTERIKLYQEEWLFSDEEAEETLCSYKQTSFVAMNIASTMINILVNYVYNLSVQAPIRSVPFKTEFEGSLLDLNVKEYKVFSTPKVLTLSEIAKKEGLRLYKNTDYHMLVAVNRTFLDLVALSEKYNLSIKELHSPELEIIKKICNIEEVDFKYVLVLKE